MILLSFFVLGLGMGNHHTIGFMFIPLLFILVVMWKELPFATIALSVVLFLAGFSVYLFLYFRSLTSAFINYSPVYSFSDFLDVFFRMNYGGGTLGAVARVYSFGLGWLYSFKNIGLILSPEIHPAEWVLAILGMIGLFREKKLFFFILISTLTWVLLARMTVGVKLLSYKDISVISSYYVQLIPIIAVIATAGIFQCYEKIKKYSVLVSGTLVTGLILFQVLPLTSAIQKSSLSDFFIADNWIKNISNIFKPKSLYLAFGDNPGFLSFYGFGVERRRDDVLCLDAATGVNDFRFTVAPSQKFSVWYPELELYRKTHMLPGEFLDSFLNKGKLYASSKGSVPDIIKDQFTVRDYVMSALILPGDFSGSLKERFMEDFNKIDYLPAVLGVRQDILATEIMKYYMFTLWKYAQYLASENAKNTDYYYRLAIFISVRPLKYDIIRDYSEFITMNRGAEAARNYVHELENAVTDDETKKELVEIEKGIKGISSSSRI